MGFYPYLIGSALEPGSKSDNAISVGWIVLTEVYSISSDEFGFYKLVNQQLTPTYTLFDPISTQIPSNIRLTTDTTQYMLGYFEVASVAKRNTFYYVLPSLRYTKKAVSDTFAIDFDKYGNPPFVWISNNDK